MTLWKACGVVVVALAAGAAWAGEKPAAPPMPVAPVVVETNLGTFKDCVPQCAYDGKADTYFRSDTPAKAGDTFTLTLKEPARVKGVEVLTGTPEGQDAVAAGVVETSADGKTFTQAAPLASGAAKIALGGKEIKAVRVRVTADAAGPIAIREFTLDATPAVPVFKYPFEIDLDVSDAPDMKEWAEKAQHLTAAWYPVLCEALIGDAYAPPRRTRLTFKHSTKGIAYTAGDNITCMDGWFKEHLDDAGAVIHESVHVIQSYHAKCPGWLVEGIADYARFWIFEPQTRQARLDPERIKYTDSYRTTGAFLAWLTRAHGKDVVKNLNIACHQGKYKDEVWKEYAGKDLDGLWEEFKKSLAAK